MSQNDSYKNFILGFVAFFFLFPAALAFFNYQVDPNHRYRFSLSDQTLRQLALSENFVLTLPENYDDRILLKKFVRAADSSSVAVLGGSRVLNLQPEMFTAAYQDSFLNAGVTAGTIRDYIAVWQLIKQAGHKPEIVFIGIEEQSLNSVSQNNRYLAILEFYEAFFQKDLSLRVKFMGIATDMKDLLSLQTTVSSVKKILAQKTDASRLIGRENFDGIQAARTSSFSMIYPKTYAGRPVESISRQGHENGVGETKVFEKWNPADRRGYDQLRALVQDIKKTGAVPVILGMPYHPEAFRVISGNPKAVKNMILFIDEIKALAASENVLFYDAIIAHRGAFGPEDFMDGVHLKVPATYRLFSSAGELSGKKLFSGTFQQEYRELS